MRKVKYRVVGTSKVLGSAVIEPVQSEGIRFNQWEHALSVRDDIQANMDTHYPGRFVTWIEPVFEGD